MVSTCRGIVRSGKMIELETPAPYPEGTEIRVDLEPVDDARWDPPSEEAVRRFMALVGSARSGLSDVSSRKYDYLAEAYADRHEDDADSDRPA